MLRDEDARLVERDGRDAESARKVRKFTLSKTKAAPILDLQGIKTESGDKTSVELFADPIDLWSQENAAPAFMVKRSAIAVIMSIAQHERKPERQPFMAAAISRQARSGRFGFRGRNAPSTPR